MDAMTTTSEDVSQMTDAELAQAAADTRAEIERRHRIREAERTTDDMALAYLQAAGRTPGGPFEAPVGFIGAYPRGWRVIHDGKAFEAAAPGVTTPPPDTTCWTEVDPASPVIPFWEPREYAKGDLARDAGQTWRALADGTDGPRPCEFPGGWTPTT